MVIEDVSVLRVRASHRGDWLLVRVHAADGRVGLGEASQSGNDTLTIECLLGQVRPRVRGQDPRMIHAILRPLRKSLTGIHETGVHVMTALSGLEQALWDLLGQSVGLPLHALWGGRIRDRVRLYANLNRSLRERSPEAFGRAARAAVAEGFTAVKIAPFDDVEYQSADRESAYRAGLDRVAAAREAIGPTVHLMVDCHGRFAPGQTIRLLRDLEPFVPFWVEEPINTHAYVDSYRTLRIATGLSFAAGEYEAHPARFQALLAAGVQYVMMDIKHCGGLWDAIRVAGLAEGFGAMVSPHSPSGPVSQAASLHLCAVVPNLQWLEFPWGEADWRADLICPAERIAGGHLEIPTAPGLGVTLNSSAVEQHLVDERSGIRS